MDDVGVLLSDMLDRDFLDYSEAEGDQAFLETVQNWVETIHKLADEEMSGPIGQWFQEMRDSIAENVPEEADSDCVDLHNNLLESLNRLAEDYPKTFASIQNASLTASM
jgi:hypothetical protein